MSDQLYDLRLQDIMLQKRKLYETVTRAPYSSNLTSNGNAFVDSKKKVVDAMSKGTLLSPKNMTFLIKLISRDRNLKVSDLVKRRDKDSMRINDSKIGKGEILSRKKTRWSR